MGKELGIYIENLMKNRESDLVKHGIIKGGKRLSRNYMAKEVLKVSNTWFSGVINGDNEPSDEMLLRIANFLGVEEHMLFLVAERVHPKDFEKFKNDYLFKLKNKYKTNR